VLLAAALIVVGGLFFWAGKSSGPHDAAEAKAFRADPSCSAAAIAAEPPGACTWKPMTVLSAEMRESGFSRTRTHTPIVAMRFADGTFDEEEVDGSAGNVFVESVRSGAPGRAQVYRGSVVRIVSGEDSAETVNAPDVAASSDTEMVWAGVVMAAIAALVLYVAFRAPRMSADHASA
jgi:hypothetical protein